MTKALSKTAPLDALTRFEQVEYFRDPNDIDTYARATNCLATRSSCLRDLG